MALAFKFLKDTGPRPKDRVDFVGIVTLALGLFGVLAAITRLATSALSVTTTGLRLGTFSLDAPTMGLLVGGVVMLGVFVAVQLRKDEPTLDLSLLRIPTVTPTLLAALLQCLANFAVVFLVIMFLQGARNLSLIHASLLVVPGYFVGTAIAPLAGWLADRAGPVIPATAGLAAQVVAVFVYSRLSLSTGLWVVVVASVLNGIGASAFWPSNGAALIMAVKPETFGVASGAYGLSSMSGWCSLSPRPSWRAPARSRAGWHLPCSLGRHTCTGAPQSRSRPGCGRRFTRRWSSWPWRQSFPR